MICAGRRQQWQVGAAPELEVAASVVVLTQMMTPGQ